MNMDIDTAGNIMMGIVSNDTIYNLDTSVRTSTDLLSVSVPAQGTYSVSWSKVIDVKSARNSETFPLVGSFSPNDNSAYVFSVAAATNQTDFVILLINATSGALLQSY